MTVYYAIMLKVDGLADRFVGQQTQPHVRHVGLENR